MSQVEASREGGWLVYIHWERGRTAKLPSYKKVLGLLTGRWPDNPAGWPFQQAQRHARPGKQGQWHVLERGNEMQCDREEQTRPDNGLARRR